MSQRTEEATTTPETSRPVHPALAMLIGVAIGLLALFPWLTTGLKLPLQNLWATNALPQDMPRVLIPLNNYFIGQIFALLLIGAAIAGAVVALSKALSRPLPARFVLFGLLVFQFGALTHAALATKNGLETSDRATAYVAGLTGGAAITIVLGIFVMMGIAHGRHAPATLAIAVSAVALGIWLSSVVFAVVPISTVLPVFVFRSIEWLPPIITGVAVGWCGVRNARRTVASILAVLIIWVGPALITAASYGLGSRMYLKFPHELVEASQQLFRSALGTAGYGPQRIAITLVTAAIAWFAFGALARSRAAASGLAPAEPASAPEPSSEPEAPNGG